MKRKLTLGQIVFDVITRYFGVIVAIEDNKIFHLDMTARGKDKPNFDCERENYLMLEEEISGNELKWTCDNEEYLYEVAWGLVDSREKNLVCYEHNDTEDKYPFYSPYLDENLFTFEVEKM